MNEGWPRYVLVLELLAAAGCATAGRSVPEPAEPTAPSPGQDQAPFFDARSRTAEYAGPGRDDLPPVDLEVVKLGWFGPAEPDHPYAGQMWQAATLAIDEANRAGGFCGLPFRLIPSWSENPWGTGVRGITRLVYDEKVWAIVGGPDGSSAHLAEQVVAKARLALVSPVATDKTANLANVAWIFSCAPGDHLLAPVVAEALITRSAGQRLAVVSCTDHDSRMFTAELLARLKRGGVFPALHVQFRPSDPDFTTQLQSLRQARAGLSPPWAAVALIAGPLDGARFLAALRRAGLTMPVFGGPSMGHRLFVDTAGEFAEGVVFPLLWHRLDDGVSCSAVGDGLASAHGEQAGCDAVRAGLLDDSFNVEGRRSFAARFRDRFDREPDYTAAYAYDAVTLLIDAIHTAGLNRARIHDALRELSPWCGVTGPITWDPTGHNHHAVGLGVIRRGEIEPLRQGGTR